MAQDSTQDSVLNTEPADTLALPPIEITLPLRERPVDEEDDFFDAEENLADEDKNAAAEDENVAEDENTDEEAEGPNEEDENSSSSENDSEDDSSDEEESSDAPKPAYINWPPPEDNPWPPRESNKSNDRFFGIRIGRCETDPMFDTSRLISRITFSHEKFPYGRMSSLDRSKDPEVRHIRQQSVRNSAIFRIEETVYRVYEDRLYIAIPKPLAKYIREKGRHGGINHDVQVPSSEHPDFKPMSWWNFRDHDSTFKSMNSWWDFRYFETLGDVHPAPEDFAFVRVRFGSCGLSDVATFGVIKEARISMILFRFKQPETLEGRDKDKAHVELDRVTGIYTRDDSDEDLSFLHYLLDVWHKNQNGLPTNSHSVLPLPNAFPLTFPLI